MNISKGILIGIIAGVLTSGALAISYDFSQAEAQMGGMMGGGHSSSDGSSSGMMSGGMMGHGGPSMHGLWYAPGSVHQQCHMQGNMPPQYCEPYYKVMSSVVGVRVSNVDPIDEKTLRVTLKEISVANIGINEVISVSIGSGDLVGTATVGGGWSGSTTVDVPVKGMGHIYQRGTMHVHIFPVTG